MTLDEMVERILSRCPGVSRESVFEKLKLERARAGGLISDEALMRMIAADFGCNVPGGEAVAAELLFHSLIPGLNDVSVVGRVVAVFSPKAFSGNRKGRLASILLADRSGILRVVLWNDKAGLAEAGGVKVGDVVRFRHGYTREDYGGRVEVQVGEKGTLEVSPEDLKLKAFPSISRFSTKIRELPRKPKGSRVNLVGEIVQVGSVSEFERPNGSGGKVLRLALSDGTGEATVVIWNEKVDEVMGLINKEVELQVVDAKVKRATVGGLEIHVDGATYVGVEPSSELSQLASLRESSEGVNVVGEVVSKPMVREVRTAKQEVLKLATFELKDETGTIWVSAWRSHADSVKDFKVGDRIIIKNAYVKRGFGDQLGLSTRNATSIIRKSVQQN